jgi:hypothetical protein
MTPSTYNSAIASALQANAAIASYCATNFGRGCLVQENENPGDPLTYDDAPWLCCLVWPTAELGPIIDANTCEIVISAGVGPLLSNSTAMLVTETTARGATTNGLRSWGNATAAEALLALAITAAKAIGQTGAIIDSSRIDTDAWAHYPLQIASAVISIKEFNTL